MTVCMCVEIHFLCWGLKSSNFYLVRTLIHALIYIADSPFIALLLLMLLLLVMQGRINMNVPVWGVQRWT